MGREISFQLCRVGIIKSEMMRRFNLIKYTRIWLAAIALFSIVPTLQGQQVVKSIVETPTVIFLVRHAEQEQGGKGDPLLTEQGKARAELLSSMLSKTSISAAYSTKVLRATNTAAPVIKSKGIPLSNYRIEDDETLFVKSILQKHKGGNILVIGHSGNIAELLNAATQSKQYDDKAIDQFSDFYILTFVADNPAIVTRLSYGSRKE